MIFRRPVVRQRAIIRADKHFVAMLTFCGEIIGDDDHNNHLEAEERRGSI